MNDRSRLSIITYSAFFTDQITGISNLRSFVNTHVFYPVIHKTQPTFSTLKQNLSANVAESCPLILDAKMNLCP